MKTELEINSILSNKSDALSSLCRICLSEGAPDSVSLFGNNESLLEKVMLCTRVRIHRLEGLPSVICPPCSAELAAADSFRAKCEHSDSVLRKLYSSGGLGLGLPTPALKVEDWIKLEEDSSILDPDSSNDVSKDYGSKFTRKSRKRDGKKSKSSHSQDQNDTNKLEESFLTFDTDSLSALDDFSASNSIIIKTENDGKVFCDICSKVLGNKYTLEKHIRTVHSEEKKRKLVSGYRQADKRFHCPECAFSAVRKFKLLNHLRVHTGEKPFACAQCGRRFSQKTNLSMHLKTHGSAKDFVCDACGKQFRHKQNYKRHQRVHESSRAFACALCGKLLKSAETLKSHMDRHYNIKNFGCELCGMMFVTRVELCNHSKKHSAEKSFLCDVCDFRTRMKKNLVKHVKRHAGLRPFKCEQCEGSFFCAEKLKYHMRKHTKEKNYACPVCLVKFCHSSSVNKHMARIHGIQYRVNDSVDRRVVK